MAGSFRALLIGFLLLAGMYGCSTGKAVVVPTQEVSVGASEQGNFWKCDIKGIPNIYDRDIRGAVKDHWPSPYKRHWCLLKALLYTESHLDPNARSGAGAKGIAQFLDGTFRDVLMQNPEISGNVFNAKAAITASAIYTATLMKSWTTKRTFDCLWPLVLASYNAGFGNVLRAQVASGGRLCWDLIGPYMYRVTGDHSVETLAYVYRNLATVRKLSGLSFG